MRIRRFTGTGVRETMEAIRSTVGSRAVILSTRKLPNGDIEIVAAVERARYEMPESARRAAAAALAVAEQETAREPRVVRAAPGATRTLPSALQPQPIRRPVSAEGAEAPLVTAAPAPVPGVDANSVAPVASAAATANAPDSPIRQAANGIHQDIDELRRTLEFYLSGLKRDAASRQSAHDAATADALRFMRIADDVIDALLAGNPARAGTSPTAGAEASPCQLLARGLSIETREPGSLAGRVALVGLPGAGKTTTVAKLAALAVARGGPEQVAIVTDACYHVGSSARLDAYARLLGVPVYRFETPKAFPDLMNALSGYALVLVDGAGLSPAERAFGAYAALLRKCAGLEVLLVLPTTVSEPTLDAATRAWMPAEPGGCVLTKLDATACLGDALSVVLRHRLRCVWGTDGQRIPAGIHQLAADEIIGRLEHSVDDAWRCARHRVQPDAVGKLAFAGQFR